MKLGTDRIGVPILVAATLLVGCDKSTSPNVTQPVAFRLAAASTAAPATIGDLALASFRLAVGDAALGAGDQFGCKDCQNNGAESPMTPLLLNVPLDGKAVDVTTEQVQPGSYATVEIGVAPLPSTVLGQTPDWPADATLEVTGTFSGQPFTLSLPITGTFVEQLAAPVVVGAGGTTANVQVNITLPVSSWFNGPSGPLNPADPAQRATIEANARRSFSTGEAKGSSEANGTESGNGN